MGTALAILVLVGVLLALAHPFWRPPLFALGGISGPASTLADLEQRKTSIYSAIREAGFDFRTDKITQEDYHDEVERLKAEAINVIAQIEAIRHETPRGSDTVEAQITAARQGLGTAEVEEGGPAQFCTRCGQRADGGDLFCGSCGAALKRHT